MAHKSALGAVMAMQIPVVPSKGGQGPYFRSKKSIQTSAKLKRFQSCVGDRMRGESGNRSEIRAKFKAAASSCKGA